MNKNNYLQINSYFENMIKRCSPILTDSTETFSNKFPYNRAQMAAYQDWINFNANSSNYYECDDLPWDDEISDYVETIKDAGIYEFAVTDHSSNLMNGLHSFSKFNYKIISTCDVIHIEKRWNGVQKTVRQDILLRLNDSSSD